MRRKLEEIERNMESILEEVNKAFGNKYQNLEISLWPTRSKPFLVNLWDGQNHALLNQFFYDGTSKELVEWLTKKQILFQKFDKVL